MIHVLTTWQASKFNSFREENNMENSIPFNSDFPLEVAALFPLLGFVFEYDTAQCVTVEYRTSIYTYRVSSGFITVH